MELWTDRSASYTHTHTQSFTFQNIVPCERPISIQHNTLGHTGQRQMLIVDSHSKNQKKHPNQSDENKTKQAGQTSDVMVIQSRQFTNYGREAFLVETLKAK